MTGEYGQLPNPSRQAVSTWLKRLSIAYLHDKGWDEVNTRSHELAMGGRQLANANFLDNPEAQAAFYAGMTYGLLGNVHFADIEHMAHHMTLEAENQKVLEPARLDQMDTTIIDGDDGVATRPHAA